MIVALLTSAFAQGLGMGVELCLRANDVPCAEQALERLQIGPDSAADLQALQARVAFHKGDYPSAKASIDRALAKGWEDTWNSGPLYERTLYATSGWTEVPVEVGGKASKFRLRFLPGLDEVLLDGAGEALLLSEKNVTPLIGATPPGLTMLEIFPDSRSFIAASSLTESDVRTTGVVALSKWTRLLITSPRALARGYDWQDTVAHEYIHLVVAHNTNDQAPVWLQEAIAKYLDNRWRDGKDGWELSVRQKGLLAEAIEADDLVTFDEMHPSLAKLPTAERAALAYAQVSALMAFCFEKKGEGVLLEALPLIKGGMDAREGLARGAGFPDFAALEAAYLAWLRALDLTGGKVVDELPTVFAEDAVDDGAVDPVLSEREDLHRFVRLGTLLRERKRPKAALVEYDKARDPKEPNSPYLANMIAQTQIQLGDLKSAEAEIRSSLADYPDFALSHKTLGALLEAQGKGAAARLSYAAAAELNPYDPSVQESLKQLAMAAGDTPEFQRRERLVRILRQGGSNAVYTPLHNEKGTFVLPGGAESSDSAGLEAAFKNEAAPAFRVEDLLGETFNLADYQSQVVVVDFWATWCGPCVASIPHLNELNARDGVTVIGLTDELATKVAPFAKQQSIGYRIGIDKGGATKGRYKVRSLPTAFVIGPRGRVEAVVVGAGPDARKRLFEAVDDAVAL